MNGTNLKQTEIHQYLKKLITALMIFQTLFSKQHLNKFHRLMVQFTFDGLFRTNAKGLPSNTGSPDPYSYITMNHFVYSVLVEVMLGLILLIYTAFAVYRVFYKIKNQKLFLSDKGIQQPEEKQFQKEKKSEPQQNTNDNLIYRFDEEENQKEKKSDKEEEEEEEEDQQNEQEQETASQQTTEWFLDLDHKMLFVQPFLISFVVVINIFVSNIGVIILMALMLLCYFVFNIKEYCSKFKILQSVFVLPCIVTFFMVYFEDRDMST